MSETKGAGMSRHHASVVVSGKVPDSDMWRFASLMSRGMTSAEIEEARAIYLASGQHDATCEKFFKENKPSLEK